jgi:hypothetical protein
MTSLASSTTLARGWIRGPLWDGFWVLNGLWLAPLLWIVARGHEDPYASPADDFYLVLTLCFWIGHRLSSSYLAYCTTAYRPVLRAQPIRFVGVPVVVASAVFTLLLLPDDALALPRSERVFWLAISDYVFVSYHFAAQHYGILSLYRVRGGEVRSRRTRLVDRVFALGIGGVLVIAAEVIAGNVSYQGQWLDPILADWWNPSPHVAWSQAHAGTLAWSGSLVVVVAAVPLFVLALRRGNLPRSLYLLSVAVMVWMAFHVTPLLFVMAWTAQHWMAATGLTARVAAGDPEPGRSRWYRLWHIVNRRPVAVVVFLGVLSALLMPAMEVEAVAADEPSYSARLVPALVEWLTQPELIPFLVALGFATAFVHYLLDRALYRFSDPAVRSAARGLVDPPPGRPAV